MSKIKITDFKGEADKHNTFEGYNKEALSPHGKKLLKEWKKINQLARSSDVITYIVRKRNREGLPKEYEIIFNINSIVGVKKPNGVDTFSKNEKNEQQLREPIFGNVHRLSIVLPNNYPSAYGGNPEFKMITDTWHPNIRASGKFKGRICLNNKDLGVRIGLDERIIRVGKYLQYQIYWANETYPWPEDKTVAEWVRDEAEPNKWVNINEGIYTDYSTLYTADKSFENTKSIKSIAGKEEESDAGNLTIKI